LGPEEDSAEPDTRINLTRLSTMVKLKIALLTRRR
jgi:hypothetical protein